MKNAMEHLEMTIDELGPFDGVLGFSQGAALAVAYIYDQQVHGRMVPFNFALCFSPVLAFSADEHCTESVIKGVCARRVDLSAPTTEIKSLGLASKELAFVDVITRVVMPAKRAQAMLPDHDLGVYSDGDGTDAPRLMVPQLVSEKINIPTIFVSGKRDMSFMRDMSEITRGLCNEKMMKKLEHSGSHQPPQRETEVRAAVRAMEWAIGQSSRMANVHL
ncbi:hypothetical protein CkaCkLH20_00903 [Colletotrichum karsti]|uniref:Serine hydrolase domain-containing protein n=1 Tax=Colletotrichum karsti TaxID=1095194 RepID=A0A9P6IE72_9PEZI|nr:uncharacterized protein CkaCkLH20_00903 [Colletotrichum karsti]KAF9881757.1 hypothetical protein CkaCkLH20_00903 [Colletotrichum karsti]